MSTHLHTPFNGSLIRSTLLERLAEALRAAAPALNNLAVDEDILGGLRLERPRNPEHGDYAVNVSFLARQTRMPPPKIAEALQSHLHDPAFELTVIGGYLNFRLSDSLLVRSLVGIIHAEAPGRNESMADQRVLLEYVSANPTGPLHIGHGRWAALGDSIVRLMRHCGALVTPEFYINDAGEQMVKIGKALVLRAFEQMKTDQAMAHWEEFDINQVELPYPGDYVKDLAHDYLASAENQLHLLKIWEAARNQGDLGLTDVPPSVNEEFTRVMLFARERMLAEQQALLNRMRVSFDNWVSEMERLHLPAPGEETTRIQQAVTKLQANGYVYEQEGALWFRSTEFGDEKDRVLKKSTGNWTYLAPDIAYHDEKFTRTLADGQRYNRIINIWGADHHGYIPRMRAAIQALGHDAGQFEVLLGQLVNLIVEGEKTRMGKRRKMLTLQDVVDEVGVDATRFWMVSKSADSALDFDVDLAATASNENPVFYVQYAHARCASILRNAVESAPNVDTGEFAPPYVEAAALGQYERSLDEATLAVLFETLEDERQRDAVKALLLHLDQFETVVRDAARLRAPHFITQYGMDVAARFHSFYNVCRVLTPQPDVTKARLMLIRAIQKTLAQALELLGVSAPEKM